MPRCIQAKLNQIYFFLANQIFLQCDLKIKIKLTFFFLLLKNYKIWWKHVIAYDLKDKNYKNKPKCQLTAESLCARRIAEVFINVVSKGYICYQ